MRQLVLQEIGYCNNIHDEMNSNSNTTGLQRAGSWTPRIGSLTRRWSAISNAEEGQDAAAEEADQAISEEIDEIKRYEVWNRSRTDVGGSRALTTACRTLQP